MHMFQNFKRVKDLWWEGNLPSVHAHKPQRHVFLHRGVHYYWLYMAILYVCMRVYRILQLSPSNLEGSMCYEVMKTDLILADRQTWFKFLPSSNTYLETFWASSPALEGLGFLLCEMGMKMCPTSGTAIRIRWVDMGEAPSRDWYVAA